MNTNDTIGNKKYRPSLTANQIAYIVHLAKRELPLSQDSKSIIKTLAPFLAKIENNAIEVAYTPTPRESVLESLGGTEINTSPESKVAYNLQCYHKYIKAEDNEEGWAALSLREIEAAKEHMYINDLMTPEQEAKYEIELNNALS